MQNITINGTSITINNVDHTLNLDFYQIVDDYSIHISLDTNETIRLFDCQNTTVNGNTAQNSNDLLILFGFTI